MDRTSLARRTWVLALTMACLAIAVEARAQLGALVSPGRLSRPHASLEGVANCLSCHAAGRQVVASKCLSCHRPVAQRIALKTGVHRNVATDCVTCHVEHAGVDGELRPFDRRRFNHATETRFPLDGVHVSVACEACHEGRSFLTATPTCVSCHANPHEPTLGAQCEQCHTTATRFAAAQTRFDHNRAAFPLTGAHAKAACEACHAGKVYTGLKFAACSDCHKNPHARPMGAPCASCHATVTWETTKVNHSRTRFPLVGRHASVECVKCHTEPALDVKPRSDTCATCHKDPHNGVFKQDCAACHTETGFEKGTFDHSTTRFPLRDRHAGLACVACHKGQSALSSVPAARPTTPTRPASPLRPIPSSARSDPRARGAQDFRGLSTTCVSCHADVHRGELGTTCEQCHTARTFDVPSFTHANNRSFFGGEHRTVACAKCHAPSFATSRVSTGTPVVRAGFTKTSASCVACHQDVHLGQVGDRCESCHAVDAAHFAVVGFSHDRAPFPLTGRHAPLACDACHKTDTRAFPSGRGTARRLTGIGIECVACHADPHDGQLMTGCQSCHTVQTFAVSHYTHRNERSLRAFFAGKHLSVTCSACHKPTTVKTSPTPIASYQTSTACVTCHNDVHRGALGPDCASCHRP